jgi:hypothetical protein
MLLDIQSGCKVGWHRWSTEAEATADAAEQSESRERKFRQGYDFGYQWPGAVTARVLEEERTYQVWGVNDFGHRVRTGEEVTLAAGTTVYDVVTA